MSAIPPQPGWPSAPYGPPAPPPPPPQRHKPRYPLFTALFLSFFSTSLYRDVARNWRGIGLLYLLLLLLLTWLPPVIKGHLSFRKFARDEAPAIVDQVPSLTIQDGVVSIKEPEPYFVRDPQTGRALVYVDTSGAFNQEKEAQEALVLLSRSSMEVRQQNKTEVHDLAQVESFYVDKHIVGRWLDAAANWFGPVAYVSAVIGSLIWGLVRLLLYGLIGLIFVSAFNARLDFPALMRLSAAAMTPAIIVDTLAWTFNFGWMPCCGWSILMGIITLIYLGFAVKANAEAPPPPGAYGGYGFPPGPAPYPYPPPPQAPAPAPQQYPYQQR